MLASRYPRTGRNCFSNMKPMTETTHANGGKSTSAAQTDISALTSHQWRSETQLSGAEFPLAGFTLPSKSKFDTPRMSSRCGKNLLR